MVLIWAQCFLSDFIRKPFYAHLREEVSGQRGPWKQHCIHPWLLYCRLAPELCKLELYAVPTNYFALFSTKQRCKFHNSDRNHSDKVEKYEAGRKSRKFLSYNAHMHRIQSYLIWETHHLFLSMRSFSDFGLWWMKSHPQTSVLPTRPAPHLESGSLACGCCCDVDYHVGQLCCHCLPAKKRPSDTNYFHCMQFFRKNSQNHLHPKMHHSVCYPLLQ